MAQAHLQLSDPGKEWIALVINVSTGRRAHEHEACFYRCPTHRYNVKRRLVKRAPATEAQFQSLMEDLELSSISGSGSSDSEEDGDRSDDNGGNDDDAGVVRGNRRRAMLLSLPEEEDGEDEAAGGGAGSSRGAAAHSYALQIPQFVFQAAGKEAC